MKKFLQLLGLVTFIMSGCNRKEVKQQNDTPRFNVLLIANSPIPYDQKDVSDLSKLFEETKLQYASFRNIKAEMVGDTLKISQVEYSIDEAHKKDVFINDGGGTQHNNTGSGTQVINN